MEGRPSDQCEQGKKPQNYMICNTDPCPIWNFGGWGQVGCSRLLLTKILILNCKTLIKINT